MPRPRSFAEHHRLTLVVGAVAVAGALGACSSDADPGVDGGSSGDVVVITAAPPLTATEIATTSATAAPPAITAESSGGYEATGQSYVGPDFGRATDPILDPLPDGVYWSWSRSVSGDGSTITFDLEQRFNEDECLDGGGTPASSCPDDEFVTLITDATMRTGSGTASVLFVDGMDAPQAFRITTEELARLLAGQPPAADAPPGFVPDLVDAFVVTVRNGEVVAADQIWVS